MTSLWKSGEKEPLNVLSVCAIKCGSWKLCRDAQGVQLKYMKTGKSDMLSERFTSAHPSDNVNQAVIDYPSDMNRIAHMEAMVENAQ